MYAPATPEQLTTINQLGYPKPGHDLTYYTDTALPDDAEWVAEYRTQTEAIRFASKWSDHGPDTTLTIEQEEEYGQLTTLADFLNGLFAEGDLCEGSSVEVSISATALRAAATKLHTTAAAA